MNEAKISLCICTMNRPEDLQRCIESALRCQRPPDEIIISDDSNCEKMQAATQAVTARFPNASYSFGPRAGLAANRNACLDRATGDWIHLSDDDVLLPTDFYSEALASLAGTHRAILTGEENRHWGGKCERVTPHNADFWGFQHVTPTGSIRGLCIGATIFPAVLFTEARFDPHLRYGSDEFDIAHHALAIGYKIIHSDRVYIDHHPTPTNREGYRQLVDASRLYSTAKAYWRYERAPLKTLAFLVLGPLHFLGSAIKSRRRERIIAAFRALALAGRYLRTMPKSTK